MNPREYIESGILELYVLGHLPEAEAREVEDMARRHPEVQRELERLHETLESWAEHMAVPLPSGMKESILEAARGQKVVESAPEGSRLSRMVRKAGIWLAGVFLLLLIFQYFRAERTGEELRRMQESYAQLQEDCVEKERRLNSLETQFIALRDRHTVHIPMAGTSIAPQAYALLHWNPERNQAFLDASGLPTPPTDRQYQLWAIVKGQPTDMGVVPLESPSDTLHPVPFVETPEAFAITLEPRGGSPQPTLDQMYVLGPVPGR